jgi:[lysine-biosynthesis-protein LysW]--L-2-aminoadipate ligase
MTPEEARSLRVGDIAIGRFDVLESLDGIQAGVEVLDELEDRGVRVLNRRAALENAHDKLRTAELLASARVPHPETSHFRLRHAAEELQLPLVVKPRFGSWGADVFRCDTKRELGHTLDVIASRPWFMQDGALAQELVPPEGHDLRVVVAGGRVVGAVERIARPGEWRTNVALGATRRSARLSDEAIALAIAAAGAVGADLTGVDLLPTHDGHLSSSSTGPLNSIERMTSTGPMP